MVGIGKEFGGQISESWKEKLRSSNKEGRGCQVLRGCMPQAQLFEF